MKRLLIMSVTFTVILTAKSREFLQVVPHVENLEDFYRSVKARSGSTNSSVSPQEDTSTITESKKRICLHVSNSGIFALSGTTSVNMDEKMVHLELELTHREIFKDIDKVSSTSQSWLPFKLYTNPYKPIDVMLSNGETVKENVYVCLIRSRLRKWIKKFYISAEYNMNLATNSSNEYTTGRFLFRKHNSKEIVLKWLAEEPARVLEVSQNKIERFYQEVRKDKKPVDNEFEDPVCKLDHGQRLQVCSSIFSSMHFHGWTRYLPTDTSVSSECKKPQLALTTLGNKIESEEWMIWCSVRVVKTNIKTLFYVSRAYSANKVFLYTAENATQETVQLMGLEVTKVRNVYE